MNITFIGGGNMAGAMIGGLLKTGFRADHIRVVEADAAKRNSLSGQFLCVAPANTYTVMDADTVIVLAVKPQQMREALGQLGITGNTNLIISIMAGVTLTAISQRLGAYKRLVRAMPNTPALIAAGITGYYPMLDYVSEEDLVRTEKILRSMGSTVRVDDEGQLDVVTAVSGSGPAYVFLFIEALRAAGIELGLPAGTANKLAIETFLGAAKLAARSAEDVSILRERVTSKGGTTEAALKVFEEERLTERFRRAVEAARKRSAELGEELAKD